MPIHEQSIARTLTEKVTRHVAAGGGATTDVVEVGCGLVNIPDEVANGRLFLERARFSPDGALAASGGNYHSLVLAAYNPDGTKLADIARLDITGGTTKWAPVDVPVVAAGEQTLPDGATLTVRTVHTGTPAAAFPGGELALFFTPDEEA